MNPVCDVSYGEITSLWIVVFMWLGNTNNIYYVFESHSGIYIYTNIYNAIYVYQYHVLTTIKKYMLPSILNFFFYKTVFVTWYLILFKVHDYLLITVMRIKMLCLFCMGISSNMSQLQGYVSGICLKIVILEKR